MSASTLISRTQASPGLTGNALKLIAAAAMLLDHIGALLLPQMRILRVIGRLAFPIYAFMVAEGCRYTRSRLRYFLSIFLLGAVCQLVYRMVGGGGPMNILITFSLSIPVIYALQLLKECLHARSVRKSLLAALLFTVSVVAVYYVNRKIAVDYGFWGCMVSVAASLFQYRGEPSGIWKRLDRRALHVTMLGMGLLLQAVHSSPIQLYALLALPLLLLYSGRRGSRRLKYFFYIFYPAHLVILQGIYLLL